MKLPPGSKRSEFSPFIHKAKVRLERWIEIDGHLASVFEGRWDVVAEENPAIPGVNLNMSTKVNGSYVGRYVVLATGQLLHAVVHGQKTVTMNFPEKEDASMSQRQTSWSEARLISACEGPTLNTFTPAKLSIGESALEAYQRFHIALHEDDQTVAESLLHQGLKGAHSKGAIYQLLREHLDRHGPMVIGGVELAEDVVVEGQTARFDAIGSWRVASKSLGTVETTVTVEVSDNSAYITGLRSKVRTREDADLLEVSTVRLHSAPAF